MKSIMISYTRDVDRAGRPYIVLLYKTIVRMRRLMDLYSGY
jgi:hypothetical protein